MGIGKVAIVGAVLGTALVVAACGGDDDDSCNEGVGEITVQALAELQYEANEITVQVGEPVVHETSPTRWAMTEASPSASQPATGSQDVCVVCGSSWGCEHETDGRSLRTGLRQVPGSRADMGRHLRRS